MVLAMTLLYFLSLFLCGHIRQRVAPANNRVCVCACVISGSRLDSQAFVGRKGLTLYVLKSCPDDDPFQKTKAKRRRVSGLRHIRQSGPTIAARPMDLVSVLR